jgi:hypothetical protein
MSPIHIEANMSDSLSHTLFSGAAAQPNVRDDAVLAIFGLFGNPRQRDLLQSGLESLRQSGDPRFAAAPAVTTGDTLPEETVVADDTRWYLGAWDGDAAQDREPKDRYAL